jgi:hypothetical protein
MSDTNKGAKVLASFILTFSSNAARKKLQTEARRQKQSLQRIAERRAANLLRSLALRQGEPEMHFDYW